jgi:DNA-binding CsgD family transcriptional regulator
MGSGVQVLAQFVYAYRKAVLAGSLSDAALLHGEIERRLELHGTAWARRVVTYRQLELTFAARYEEAKALANQGVEMLPGSDGEAVARFASIRRECRAGSWSRASQGLSLFQPGETFVSRATHALAALDVAEGSSNAGALALATSLYELAATRRHGRFAGEASAAIARLGGSPPPMPPWLATAAPAATWWAWAAATAASNHQALRAIADDFAQAGLLYESGLAREQAGDVDAAYRVFRDIGALGARERVSARLRGLRQPVPRRSRAALDQDSLTDAEREICRLVASGVSNADVALQLSVSIRTVETHLTNIYRKAGQRGRVALVNWWHARPAGDDELSGPRRLSRGPSTNGGSC